MEQERATLRKDFSRVEHDLDAHKTMERDRSLLFEQERARYHTLERELTARVDREAQLTELCATETDRCARMAKELDILREKHELL